MFLRISGSLDRQAKAFILLKELMEEEFDLLISNKVDEVTKIEFSIHELLRQIADEKEATIKLLGGGKILDYVQMRPEEEGQELQRLYKIMDEREQLCVRQGHLNTEVSLALLRQGEMLLKELTTAVTPRGPSAYGRKGGQQRNSRPEAMLISGRL